MAHKDPIPTRLSKRVNNRSNKLKRTIRIILAVPLIGWPYLLRLILYTGSNHKYVEGIGHRKVGEHPTIIFYLRLSG